MKAKMLLTGFILGGLVSLSFAQVENDDMYFTSNDRVKLNASKASSDSYAYNQKKKQLVELTGESPNPTDSYSARNINPEYASRQNSKVAKQDEQDYFVANYNQQSGSQYNNWYNSYSSWNNNPWYSMPSCLPSYGYGGGSMGGYYGYSNPWGNPYYHDSYYGGGYGGSYGYYGGSSMSYGMNAYRPMGSGWGVGGGLGWAYNAGSYGRPQTVVVVNNYGNTEARQVTYGKRSGRDSGPGYATTNSPSRSRNDVSTTSNNNGAFTRTTAPTLTTTPTTQRQEDYYNRSYRNSQQTTPARSSWSNSNNSSNGRTSSGSYNNNSWSGSNSNSSSTPSYTPSPSRSSSTSGGSSGGGATHSPGSGSNGRSRGGN